MKCEDKKLKIYGQEQYEENCKTLRKEIKPHRQEDSLLLIELLTIWGPNQNTSKAILKLCGETDL